MPAQAATPKAGATYAGKSTDKDTITLKVTKSGGGQVAWHDKFGSYRSQSGRGPVVVEWRNARFWRGGRSTGGANPAPPAPVDAGVPDALVDASSPADGPRSFDAATTDLGGGGSGGGSGSPGTGGAGGAGGTSGNAGTSGTGGVSAGGAGGPSTTGGAAGNRPRPPGTGGGGGDPASPSARGSSGGCTLGGPARSDGALAITGLLVVAVAALRRGRPERAP